MKKLFKIMLWTLFTLGAAAAIGVPLAVRTDYVQSRLRATVQDLVNDAPFTITFSRVLPDILSRVEISDLEISGPDGVILSASSIVAGPLLPGILNADRSLSRVVIDGLEANLVRDAQGQWLFPVGGASGGGEEFAGFPVAIPHFAVKNGKIRLAIQDADGAVTAALPVHAAIKGSLDKHRLNLNRCSLRDPGGGGHPPSELALSGFLDFSGPLNSRFKAELKAGSLERWRPLAPGLPNLRDVRAVIEGQGRGAVWGAKYSASCAPGQSVEGDVRFDGSGEYFNLQCGAKPENVNLALFSTQLQGKLNGSLQASINGPWRELNGQATAELNDSQILSYDVSRASLTLSRDQDGKASAGLKGLIAGAKVSLSAQGRPEGLYEVQAPLNLTANGAFENLNPKRVHDHPGAPEGDLNFSVKADLSKEAGEPLSRMIAAVAIEFKPSRLKTYTLDSGGVEGRASPDGVDVAKGAVSFPEARVDFSGRSDFDGNGRIKAHCTASDLAALTGLFMEKPVSGSGEAALEASGDLRRPVFEVKADLKDVVYDGHGAAGANITLKGDWASRKVAASCQAAGVHSGGLKASQAALHVRMSREALSFDWKSSGGSVDDLAANGVLAGYMTPSKTLNLESAAVVFRGRKFKTQESSTITWDEQGASTPRIVLECDGHTVIASGRFDPSRGAVQARVHAPALNLALASSQLGLKRPLAGEVQAIVDVEGSLDQPIIRAAVSSPRVSVKEDLPGLEMSLKARCENGAAFVSGHLLPETGGRLDVKASLPLALGRPWKAPILPTEGLDASFEGSGLSLAFAAPWIQGVRELDAFLDIRGTALGDPRSPAIEGAAAFSASRIVLKTWKEPLTNVSARLAWTPSMLHIHELTARTQKEGELSASGALALEDLKPGVMDLSCQCKQFDLAYGDVVRARSDAQVRVSGQWPQLDVTGQMRVGRGEFNLDGFAAFQKQRVGVENDIQIVGEQKTRKASPLKPLSGELDVAVDGPFWIKGRGVQAELAGSVQASKKRGDDVFALRGRLEARQGVYDFRGKSFVINKGRVDFTGAVPPNPLVDMSASRVVAGVTINLGVAGPMSQLTPLLSSDPELEQTDIVSLLLFGKKASQLSNGEAKSLEDQGAAMLGAKALEEIKQFWGSELPVDMLSLETGEEGAANDLVMGKYLSPNLFIKYRKEMSSSGSDTVQLEYQLTPKLSVESQLGESDSGVDFFWSLDY